MRPRKQKNLHGRLLDCREWLWEAPGTIPVVGSRYYGDNPLLKDAPIPELPFVHNNKPLWVEIGCGKGQFIRQMAERHREWNFLGLEREPKVLLTALERLNGKGMAEHTPQGGKSGMYLPPLEVSLDNLRFVMADADRMPYFLREGSVSGFYVAFSDPWPKNRHASRRLTHHSRLALYDRLLVQGGEIRFKTDNRDLFLFSLEEFPTVIPPYFVTEDLHHSPYAKENVMTEYEQFYASKGQPIYAIYAAKGQKEETTEITVESK